MTMTEPRRNPVKAVQVLDSMLEFFDDGRRWHQGAMFDATGNCCLIGALRHIRATLRIRGDGTVHYLRAAVAPIHDDPLLNWLIGERWKRPERGGGDLMHYNDCCDDYDEIRELILQARAVAVAEWPGSALSHIEGEERAIGDRELAIAD
jgi:hypothetical protein